MNRMEFGFINQGGSDVWRQANPSKLDQDQYILVEVCKGAVGDDRIWVKWRDGNDDKADDWSREPVEGYDEYVNYADIEDDQWTRQPVWYTIKYGGEDSQEGQILAWDSYDPFEGICTVSGMEGDRMVTSRGDGIISPEDLSNGSGLSNCQNAERNYKFNPTHAYRDAAKAANRNI